MRFCSFVFTGERRLKLTGESNRLDVNADFMTTGTLLNTPTLYPSAYLVLTNKGYTKHYYAGADRVAASLGGGGLKATGSNPGMQDRAKWLFWESHERVNGRMLQKNDLECIWQGSLPTGEYCKPIDGIPGRMNASVEFYLNDLYDNLKMLAEEQHDEKDVYFYHSDHLGSASWITDADGKPIQHLQYLPFGEPFVNQHLTDYQERYLFTGKERDEETGYGYFGARYMDHELMTMWLSVDPMADKYPSISPYAYCAWNPIKLVDPDGRDIEIVKDDKNKTITIRGNFYYNRQNLGSEAEVFLNGFKDALNSWEGDIKEALGDKSLGVSGYDVKFEFGFYDCEDPRDEAKNDPIGNSLKNDPDHYANVAVVTNNKHFKANLCLHSRGDDPNAYDPTFYSTTDMQGDVKHEIGHIFGLADRYPEAKHHAPTIVGDLMHNQADTRHNAVEPFKRVWKSAGLNVKGSKTVLINHTNRETW